MAPILCARSWLRHWWRAVFRHDGAAYAAAASHMTIAINVTRRCLKPKSVGNGGASTYCYQQYSYNIPHNLSSSVRQPVSYFLHTQGGLSICYRYLWLSRPKAILLPCCGKSQFPIMLPEDDRTINSGSCTRRVIGSEGLATRFNNNSAALMPICLGLSDTVVSGG